MNNRKIISIAIIMCLSACASQAPTKRQLLEKSYLEAVNKHSALASNKGFNGESQLETTAEQEQIFRFVAPMKRNSQQALRAEDVLAQFSEQKTIKLASDGLPLKDFLHQVFGQQLNVSYILADEVKAGGKPITLNLKENISPRKLFTLTEELLSQRNLTIRFDDNIFYIHQADSDKSKGNVVYGYGKGIKNVPQSSFEIVQMVQFEYGMQATIANTLRQMLGVKASVDTSRNTIIIQAKRKDVIRALELIQMVDQPAMQNRQIGVFKTTFVATGELIKKLTELLRQEGISVGSSKSTASALSIVEVSQQGDVYFFANSMRS